MDVMSDSLFDAATLALIGAADELHLASRRADGTLRAFITIWAVAVDGELFVRSAYGPENGWYRRALASGTGRIRAGGIEADVVFRDGGDADQAALDAEYHHKYDRYGARYVAPVVGETSHPVTLRIAPA